MHFFRGESHFLVTDSETHRVSPELSKARIRIVLLPGKSGIEAAIQLVVPDAVPVAPLLDCQETCEMPELLLAVPLTVMPESLVVKPCDG